MSDRGATPFVVTTRDHDGGAHHGQQECSQGSINTLHVHLPSRRASLAGRRTRGPAGDSGPVERQSYPVRDRYDIPGWTARPGGLRKSMKYGAGGGTRTHTRGEPHRILSPARLPISPLRRGGMLFSANGLRILSYPRLGRTGERHHPGADLPRPTIVLSLERNQRLRPPSKGRLLTTARASCGGVATPGGVLRRADRLSAWPLGYGLTVPSVFQR